MWSATLPVSIKGHKMKNIPKECEHEWVYSPVVYLTFPPQRDRICRKCGKKECVRSTTTGEGEYEWLVKRFKNK